MITSPAFSLFGDDLRSYSYPNTVTSETLLSLGGKVIGFGHDTHILCCLCQIWVLGVVPVIMLPLHTVLVLSIEIIS